MQEGASPPFEPVVRDGRLYGRGAADDKAGVMLRLAVLRTYQGRPPVGVVLFIEGEEEIGSPTLLQLLGDHHDAQRADHQPAWRVDLVVEVRMLHQPVHSGMYGGPAVDALTVLARLIATLHRDDGTVAVAGLHTGESTAPDVPDEVFRSDAGVVDGVSLVGAGSIPTRLWHSPAIAFVGLDAPSVADAANILIPVARASISLRIAPGDTSANAMSALRRHLETHVEWGAQVSIVEGKAMEPFALEPTGSVYDLARAVFAEAYGNAVVENGVGGSIPFIASFALAYPGATVLVTGVGDRSSRWHGIDENLHLGMWERACLAEVLLLAGLISAAGAT